MTRSDWYRPTSYTDRGRHFDALPRRSRSRSPLRYDAYARSRSPSPVRRPEPLRATRSRAPAPGASRAPRLPENRYGDIFKGMKFYCFSEEPGTKAVMQFCRRMIDQGAIGKMAIEDADTIIIHGPRMFRNTSVMSDPNIPSIERGKRPTLAQVYESYAKRVEPARDPMRTMRKCVMQAEWAYLSLKTFEFRAGTAKIDFEIRVDNVSNTREQDVKKQAGTDIRPATPPILAVALPDVDTQPMPSLECQYSTPVRSGTREHSEAPLQASSLGIEPTALLYVSAATSTPPVSLTTARRVVPQQVWTPTMAAALPTNVSSPPLALSPSMLMSPARSLPKVSVDPRLPSPACHSEDLKAAQALQSSLPATIQATRQLQGASLDRSTRHPDQARTGANRVFARDQPMPWRFHVLNADQNRLAVVMIEQYGGGQIAPLDQAPIIVVPEVEVREANTEEIKHLVKSIGAGRAVVSIDWVGRGIADDRLLNLDPYRIRLPIADAPTSASADVKMEVDAPPAPTTPLAQPEPIRRPRTPLPYERALFIRPKSKKTTAGPPNTRRPTLPREIIMIEDDDSDDDCMILDGPPINFSAGKLKEVVVEERYPTPPQTPLMLDDHNQCSPNLEAPDRMPTQTTMEENLDDPEDHKPLSRPPKPSVGTEMPEELMDNPVEQRKKALGQVQPRCMKDFRMMEKELHEWAKRNFSGTQKAFFALMTAKHPHRRSWSNFYRIYHLLFYMIVPGLKEYGRPGQRGPQDLNRRSKEEPAEA